MYVFYVKICEIKKSKLYFQIFNFGSLTFAINFKNKKMAKEQEENKTLVALKIVGKVISIIGGITGIILASTKIHSYIKGHETPEEKRKRDKDAYKEKCDLDVEKHKRIKDIDLNTYEARLQIAQNYRNNKECDESVAVVNEPTMTLPEVLNTAEKTPSGTPLLGDFIEMGERTLIYSQDGVGKSIFAFQLCKAIADGEDCLILPTAMHKSIEPQMVLYYDTEMTYGDYSKRYANLTLKNVDNLRIKLCCIDSIKAFFNDVEKELSRMTGDTTVCLDNLLTIEKLSEDDANYIFKNIQRIQNDAMKAERVITFIIVTHSQKTTSEDSNSNYRGPNILGNHMTKRIFLSSGMQDGDIHVKIEKQRSQSTIKSFIIRRVAEPYAHFVFAETCNEDEACKSEKNNNSAQVQNAKQSSRKRGSYKMSEKNKKIIMQKLPEIKNKKITIKKVAELCNVNEKTMSSWIKDLQQTA